MKPRIEHRLTALCFSNWGGLLRAGRRGLRRAAARAACRAPAEAGLHPRPHIAQLRHQYLLAGQSGLVGVVQCAEARVGPAGCGRQTLVSIALRIRQRDEPLIELQECVVSAEVGPGYLIQPVTDGSRRRAVHGHVAAQRGRRRSIGLLLQIGQSLVAAAEGALHRAELAQEGGLQGPELCVEKLVQRD